MFISVLLNYGLRREKLDGDRKRTKSSDYLAFCALCLQDETFQLFGLNEIKDS